jgi:hypothetical protein
MGVKIYTIDESIGCVVAGDLACDPVICVYVCQKLKRQQVILLCTYFDIGDIHIHRGLYMAAWNKLSTIKYLTVIISHNEPKQLNHCCDDRGCFCCTLGHLEFLQHCGVAMIVFLLHKHRLTSVLL